MKNVFTIIGSLLLAFSASAGTFNLVEVNPAHGNCQNIFEDSSKYVYGAGDLKHFAQMNGLLYFVAADQPYNDELWVTDGTTAGTHKVKEINPNGGAHIGDLRVVNNKLVFLANETTMDTLATFDYDLFTSDGTAAGTYKINDLNLDNNTLLAEPSAGLINGQLIFCSRTNILRTDGTVSGTMPLASINVVNYVISNGYCDLNGFVYFMVNSDLWRSDGTLRGTEVVRQTTDSIHPWPLVSSTYMKALDGKLYIVGVKPQQGEELYRFGGGETDTLETVMPRSSGNSYPSALTICGGSLWFTAYDSMFSLGIFKLDPAMSFPMRMDDAQSNLSFGINKVYYTNATNNGYNIIDAVTNTRSSFAKAGTYLSPSSFSGPVNNILAMGDKIVYEGYDSASSQQMLFISDGTDAGTRMVAPANVNVAHPFDFQAGCGTIDIFDLTYYNNMIVIPANYNSAGRELWFYEEVGLVNGIIDAAPQSTATIYPNPANDKVTIDLSGEKGINADMSIQLLDINGRIVAESPIDGNKIAISTADLANGTYIATVSNGSEAILRRKLIVAH